jgi:hypothetical protein
VYVGTSILLVCDLRAGYRGGLPMGEITKQDVAPFRDALDGQVAMELCQKNGVFSSSR